jgi:hypothetical protein
VESPKVTQEHKQRFDWSIVTALVERFFLYSAFDYLFMAASQLLASVHVQTFAGSLKSHPLVRLSVQCRWTARLFYRFCLAAEMLQPQVLHVAAWLEQAAKIAK